MWPRALSSTCAVCGTSVCALLCPHAVALSRTRDSWDSDTGARDLQSSGPQQQPFHQHGVSQKLLEQRGAALEQQAALHKLLMQPPAPPLGANYLELANMVSSLFLWGFGNGCCSFQVPSGWWLMLQCLLLTMVLIPWQNVSCAVFIMNAKAPVRTSTKESELTGYCMVHLLIRQMLYPRAMKVRQLRYQLKREIFSCVALK